MDFLEDGENWDVIADVIENEGKESEHFTVDFLYEPEDKPLPIITFLHSKESLADLFSKVDRLPEPSYRKKYDLDEY